MTADKNMESTGQEQDQGTAKGGGRKAPRRKAAARGAAAKRSRTAASRRSAASRKASASESGSKPRRSGSAGSSGRSRSSASSGASRSSATSGASRSRSSRKSSGSSSSGIASRFLSRSRRAAGSALEWAAEGASRAVPLASRTMPDQRMVQRLADERPYMLGALGLGIGAMIGLMLPSPLSMRGFSSSRSSGRSRR